jgi:hypothetical protein
MFQAPIDVMSGRVLGEDALRVVGIQFLWVVALFLLGRAVPRGARPAGWWCRVAELSLLRGYRVPVGSRIAVSWPTGRALPCCPDVGGVGVVELTELYVILHNVPVFGGLNFAQAGVVFALANMGFSLADLVFGQLDSIPTLLRAGQLEALLVRPMPLMAQLVTTDFQLRRAGRATSPSRSWLWL